MRAQACTSAQWKRDRLASQAHRKAQACACASALQVNNITAAVKEGGPVVVNLPAKTFDVSHTLSVNFTSAVAPGTFTLRGEGTVFDCGRRAALALFIVGAESVSVSGLTIQNCKALLHDETLLMK